MDLRSSSNRLQSSSQLNSLLRYVISTFFPAALPLVSRNPNLLRLFGSALLLWPVILGLGRLKSIWDQTSSVLVSAVNISESETLYRDVLEWLKKRKTIRLNNAVDASLLGQIRRSRSSGSHGSGSLTAVEHVKFRPAFGTEIFFFRRHLFIMRRSIDIVTTRSVTHIMHLYCLSLSTQPQKCLLEEACRQRKEEERDETIILVLINRHLPGNKLLGRLSVQSRLSFLKTNRRAKSFATLRNISSLKLKRCMAFGGFRTVVAM